MIFAKKNAADSERKNCELYLCLPVVHLGFLNAKTLNIYKSKAFKAKRFYLKIKLIAHNRKIKDFSSVLNNEL